MIAVAGWLGIAYDDSRYVRLYAVIFGFGSGLVWDEVGFFLTFGNYNSSLTFFFFVIVMTFVTLGLLLAKYEEKLEYDVLSLENRERVIYLGLVIAGLSALAFAVGLFLVGAVILLIGLLAAAFGHYWFRKHPVR